MSYIEGVSRDALQAAYGDLAKARRALLPVAGVLALVHLLTVHPYLETAREIAGIEGSMQANAGLLAELEPEIEALQQASASAGTQLKVLLDGVTAEMVDRFAGLRAMVERAQRGETPVSPPDPLEFAPMQAIPVPQANLPAEALQAPSFPPIQQMAPVQQMAPGALLDPQADEAFLVGSPELGRILSAIAAGDPDWDELIAFARRDIVEAAYARAQGAWSQRIRPAYLRALAESTEGARRVAAQAPESAAEMVAALSAAADAMAEQRAVLEAIELRHDHVVEEALGTDWWRTVEGKGAFADAVAQSVAEQMDAVMETAQGPTEAIRAALELQEGLRDKLVRQQEELARQFAEQRAQLAGLSGTAGVVPVDLVSFIGLFPLVLGLVLGFMQWRIGQARHQGAQAAEDLARAAPEELQTRVWLARRLLAGPAPMLVTAALATGALLWIALAAWQVAGSPGNPPLAPWISGVLAALAVLLAAGWDIVAIRHLAAGMRARGEGAGSPRAGM